jgi:hypothetical protein
MLPETSQLGFHLADSFGQVCSLVCDLLYLNFQVGGHPLLFQDLFFDLGLFDGANFPFLLQVNRQLILTLDDSSVLLYHPSCISEFLLENTGCIL